MEANFDDRGARNDAKVLISSETHKTEELNSYLAWLFGVPAVNAMSKAMQSVNIDMDTALVQLKGLVLYLQKYKQTCFEEAKAEVKIIMESLDINPTFPAKRKRIIKKCMLMKKWIN